MRPVGHRPGAARRSLVDACRRGLCRDRIRSGGSDGDRPSAGSRLQPGVLDRNPRRGPAHGGAHRSPAGARHHPRLRGAVRPGARPRHAGCGRLCICLHRAAPRRHLLRVRGQVLPEHGHRPPVGAAARRPEAQRQRARPDGGGAAACLRTDRHQSRPGKRQRQRQRPYERQRQRLSHRPRVPPVRLGARRRLQREARHRALADLARSARVPRI